MDAYTSFAQVYDLFMDNVPYDKWCSWICDYLRKRGVKNDKIYSSSASRCLQTAKLISKVYKKDFEIISSDYIDKLLLMDVTYRNYNDICISGECSAYDAHYEHTRVVTNVCFGYYEF